MLPVAMFSTRLMPWVSLLLCMSGAVPAPCTIPNLLNMTNMSAALEAKTQMITCLDTQCEDANAKGMLDLVGAADLLSLGASCDTFPTWTQSLGGCTAGVGALSEIVKSDDTIKALIASLGLTMNFTVPQAVADITIGQLCPHKCCSCRKCTTQMPESEATTTQVANGAQQNTEPALLGVAIAAVAACASSIAIGLQS